METNIFLQQLSQRMDGDRRAMRKTLEILRSMIDRKLWKQMEQSVDSPVLLVPGFTDYTFVHPKTGECMRASKSAHLLSFTAWWLA